MHYGTYLYAIHFQCVLNWLWRGPCAQVVSFLIRPSLSLRYRAIIGRALLPRREGGQVVPSAFDTAERRPGKFVSHP
jgi:hypothetical protein